MPPISSAPQTNPPPLVVDLDGTLIKTDLLWESLARLLRQNPFQLFPILFWWTTRGRAFLKRQLAARVTIDPATLPFNQPFLAFLREQKKSGRKLILATASDREMALPVANYLGLFDEVLGSDGKTNLRGANKLKALTEKFGERGFDYAGNSVPDLAIWRGAREAIVVNASRALLNQAAQCARTGPTFIEDYSPFETAKSFLDELLVRSGYLLAIGAGLLLTAAFPKIGIAGFAWVAPALLVFAAQIPQRRTAGVGARVVPTRSLSQDQPLRIEDNPRSGADAFRVGYVAGLAHFLSSLYWLLLMPVVGLPILAWLALGAYLALYPAIWTWLVSRFTFHVSGSWLQRTTWSLGGAAAWVALEMVRARLLGGFPWTLIGVSQFKMVPLIQIASVAGVYGVSFLIVWTSLSLYSAMRLMLRQPSLRLIWQAEIILPFVAVVALFVFGFARLSRENSPGSALRVTLIQPGIPQTLIWNPAEDTRRFQELLAQSAKALQESSNDSLNQDTGRAALPRRLAEQQLGPTGLTERAEVRDRSAEARAGVTANQVDNSLAPHSGERASPSSVAVVRRVEVRGSSPSDLLLWPESAVPETDEATCLIISRFAQLNRVWLILNGDDAEYLQDTTNYFNAAYLVGPDGRWLQVYHKRKLVIFGEYVPLAHWLPFLKYLTPITGGWTPGDQPAQFQFLVEGRDLRAEGNNVGAQASAWPTNTLKRELQRIKTSPLICFEDVFPGLARDAADDDTDFLVNLTNDGWFRQSAEQWQHLANAVFRTVENGLPLVRCANNGITCWIDANGRVREIFRDNSGSVYGVGALTVEIPIGNRHEPTFYNRHGDWFGWSCVIWATLLALRRIFARTK